LHFFGPVTIFVLGLILLLIVVSVHSLLAQHLQLFAQGASTQNNVTTESFVPYVNPKYQFAMQYPQNWIVKEEQNNTWFTSPVDQSGKFRIGSNRATNHSLSDLVAIYLQELDDSFKDFKIIQSNFTSLGGVPANLTSYSFALEDRKLFTTETYKFIGMLISTIKSDNLYTVTYFSSPENFNIYLPTVKKMISTINIP
jgi:PsbP-like protein